MKTGKAVVAGPRQQSRSCCPQRDYVCSFEVKNYDVMADAILKCGGTIALPNFAVTWVCRRGYRTAEDRTTGEGGCQVERRLEIPETLSECRDQKTTDDQGCATSIGSPHQL
jgi:hypothetical protein